jgi:hypothetical protein
MLVGYTVKLAMVVILYIYMYSVNASRDREASTAVDDAEDGTLKESLAIERGMQDMTELDNKGFRYAL